ncbi:hypothetical protein AB0L40_27275, partial [Patulibacter sp. NPDC049589]
MTTQPSAPLDAFLRGVDRRSDLRAALLTGGATDPHGPFELRPALDVDREALERVAGRDSSVVPDGPLLLAEAAGVVIAAIGLENRRVVADPFWPTARAVDALQAAAAEHHGPGLAGRLPEIAWTSASSTAAPSVA